MCKNYNEWDSLRGHTGVVKVPEPVYIVRHLTQKQLDYWLKDSPGSIEQTTEDEWDSIR